MGDGIIMLMTFSFLIECICFDDLFLKFLELIRPLYKLYVHIICDAKSEKVDKLSYFCGLVALLRINAANCKIVIAVSDRKITRCGKVAY